MDSVKVTRLGQRQYDELLPEVIAGSSYRLADIFKAFLL